MRLARHCPTVSHLLFADDPLFFVKADEENAKNMALILKNYENVSGQKVNQSKSSIIFGVKIANQRRANIHQILEINNVEGEGKYLGLPEQFSRRKVNDFQGVIDQVRAQVSQWYHQLLSPAGKEVLIKSVLQAKPVYPMSCFLLSKSISTLIADGASTNVWSDNWLPTLPPRKLLYPTTRPEMKVAELINSEDRSWNVPELNKMLSPADAIEVQSIKLSYYFRNNEYAGLGCIVRDDQGRLMGLASMKILTTQMKNAFVGEAYAFLFALQQVWIKGWRQVWFESDNLELVKIINTKSAHLDLW
ncbi:hypothetical protein Bca52824_024980 [Brassica carinata]|uniref:RNase H type-1 domain-containing protein n=1 Tax=Brassica carinata TaxID=52824 RepID=A0A8X7VLQ5_BRACI|nr:hypothetical protein Bca52824_024980 [Brassica carinata]